MNEENKKKENITKIAVYGTLRKGFGNHRLLQNSKFVGAGLTKEKYKMTASGIPFVNPNKKVSNIRVEVYDVTDSQLPYVDALEGYNPNDHDGSWYKRTPIEVKLDDGDEIEASIYFSDSEAASVIESGDYKDYNRTNVWN